MDFSDFDVFSEKASVADAERVQLLDPEQVYPDPENVRSEIDPAAIGELAASIKERGLLQPIIVAPKDADGRYRIMFGERRWRACKKLGVQVRAIVVKADDDEHIRIDQFIENDQRENLSTADMIRFVTSQVAKGRTLAELARVTGRNRTLLTRYQGLAKAPDYIAALFNDISMRSAVALAQAAKVDDEATRAFVAGTAAEDLTVLACERFARDVGAKKGSAAPIHDPAPSAPVGSEERKDVDVGEDVKTVQTHSPSAPMAEEVGESDTGRAPAETGGSAAALTVYADEVADAAPRPSSKPKSGKARVERPTIEIDGKRAMVVEALLHFDGEAEPRILSWR